MPQKVDFTDYDKILENFDAFCDEFESRASNAFMRGDQNDGRVTGEVERTGEDCPVAVREIAEPGPTDLPIRSPTLMYHRPTSEEYETVAQTLDYLHNNVEGIKGDLSRIARSVSY